MVTETKEDNSVFINDKATYQRENEEIEIMPGEDIEVESWHREAVKLLDFASSRNIENTRDMELAADDLAVIGRLKKTMAERRQLHTKPLDEQVKAINETYRELMIPAEEAEKITRKKMRECRAEQERLHRQQADRPREAGKKGGGDAENQGQ